MWVLAVQSSYSLYDPLVLMVVFPPTVTLPVAAGMVPLLDAGDAGFAVVDDEPAAAGLELPAAGELLDAAFTAPGDDDAGA